MRSQVAFVASILAFAAVATTAATASAQRVVVVEEGRGGGGGGGGGGDFARFRFGVDLTGGGLFLNNFSAGLVGADLRLGIQLNNLVGIYAQPHLVFGVGTYDAGGTSASAFTGATGVDGLIDFTFDHLFIGGGGGFTYVGNNNFYASPEAHFRFGAYPVIRHGFGGRRKGLMVGVDLHLIYWTIPGNSIALMEPMFLIGYEAF